VNWDEDLVIKLLSERHAALYKMVHRMDCVFVCFLDVGRLHRPASSAVLLFGLECVMVHGMSGADLDEQDTLMSTGAEKGVNLLNLVSARMGCSLGKGTRDEP